MKHTTEVFQWLHWVGEPGSAEAAAAASGLTSRRDSVPFMDSRRDSVPFMDSRRDSVPFMDSRRDSVPVTGPRRDAVLVMDSRANPVLAVCHQGLRGLWSKLYRAGRAHLDLSLRAEGAGLVLVGQLIGELPRQAGLRLTLHGPSGSRVSPAGGFGHFRLAVAEPGPHALEFEFGGETFLVEGLEV